MYSENLEGVIIYGSSSELCELFDYLWYKMNTLKIFNHINQGGKDLYHENFTLLKEIKEDV